MAAEASYPFKQAKNFRRGRIDTIQYWVVHCTASPENAKGTGAEAVQNYFATTDRLASAHVTVDNNSTVRSVHDWDTSFGAAGFNANGLHLELVGMANQTRAQWLDPISNATLHRGARVIAEWAKRYSLPLSYMSIPNLAAGTGKGGTFHADCDKAKRSTGHTDPGVNFPRADFLAMVKAASAAITVPAVRTNPYLSYAAPTRRGDTGGKVRFVEWAMGLPVDGTFGDEVNAAIRALQHKHGRPVTGEVGHPQDPEDWTMRYLKSITRR